MKKYKLQDKVYYSLKGLYFASIEIQNHYFHGDYDHAGGPQSNLREFATLKFSGTRRLGHSTAISRLVNEFDLYAAVIVPNRRMFDSIIDRNPHFYRGGRFAKCTIEDIERGFTPRHIPNSETLDLAVVDDSGHYTERQMDDIYGAFQYTFEYAIGAGRNFFLLFVG